MYKKLNKNEVSVTQRPKVINHMILFEAVKPEYLLKQKETHAGERSGALDGY